jgi:hypothetical protein
MSPTARGVVSVWRGGEVARCLDTSPAGRARSASGAGLTCGVEPRILKGRDPEWTCIVDGKRIAGDTSTFTRGHDCDYRYRGVGHCACGDAPAAPRRRSWYRAPPTAPDDANPLPAGWGPQVRRRFRMRASAESAPDRADGCRTTSRTVCPREGDGVHRCGRRVFSEPWRVAVRHRPPSASEGSVVPSIHAAMMSARYSLWRDASSCRRVAPTGPRTAASDPTTRARLSSSPPPNRNGSSRTFAMAEIAPARQY